MDYLHLSKSLQKNLLFSLFLLLSTTLKPQDNDIGVFLGGAYYMGNINPDGLFYQPQPAFGLIFRKNYNPFVSLSYEATFGNLVASDANFKTDTFRLVRGATLKQNIVEGAINLEYNFFAMRREKKHSDNFSPYIKFGVAVVSLGHMQVCVPFGLGLKYRITKKVEIAMEWTYRRTFSDKLDGLSIYYAEGKIKDRQQSFPQTRDWYSFFGLNLHYNLAHENIKCPAYSNFQ